MNILVVTAAWFPDVAGGFPRVARDVAYELAERGHRVVVLAPGRSGVRHEGRAGRVTVNRVLRSRGLLPTTFTDTLEAHRYGRRYEVGDFDVVMAHGCTVARGLQAAQPQLPLALVFHASAVRELRFDRSKKRFGFSKLADYALDPLIRTVERTALNGATRVLVLSRYTKSLVAAEYPAALGRVRQVSGGVNAEKFRRDPPTSGLRARYGVPADACLLLTVRRLEPRMGLDVLLRAMTHLPPSRDVRLVIAGDGTLSEALRNLAEDLGLRTRVLFTGHVSEDELRAWYRTADLFVLPSVAYEGFGMVTLEALASGTPVIGTPVGATPELLEPLDRALISAGADPSSLGDGIARALDLLTPTLRARCRTYVERHFDWPKAIVSWERVLAETADTAGSSVERPERWSH